MMRVHFGEWDHQLKHWIHFRNSHHLVPVIVQSFMVLCAFLIVLGLVYVIILVIAIAIHHVLFDRDPKKVPDYVKNSIQFSSESDNTDDDAPTENDSSDEKDSVSKASNYAQQVRKMAALDKFMGSNSRQSEN